VLALIPVTNEGFFSDQNSELFRSSKSMAFKDMFDSFCKTGELVWIGLRTELGGKVVSVDEVLASVNGGLVGDSYSGKSGTRQVTLLQQEHLAVVESLIGRAVLPQQMRRNLLVSGINLLALKKCRFRVGQVLLETTGLCHPCSKMERELGPGGFNAMRGHGGLTARVIESAVMRLGDPIIPEQSDLFSL